jgi:hypothetical protein
MQSCDESFTKLISLLEYKFGKLVIREQDTQSLTQRINSTIQNSKAADRSVLDTR